MKCTDFIAQDHKTILRSLNILAEIAARVRNGDLIENGDVEMILKFLRANADTIDHVSSPRHGGFWWARLRWFYQWPPSSTDRAETDFHRKHRSILAASQQIPACAHQTRFGSALYWARWRA